MIDSSVPGFESIYRFDSILGQEKPVQLLTTLLRNATIPHALLFTGIEGIGKQSAAMVFAMACNCLNPDPKHTFEGRQDQHTAQYRPATTNPCGSCKSCRKIQSGNHPDVITLKPSGPFIRIGQIRDLCYTLTLKPYEAKFRVVVIKDSQAMNPAASNAFLKVLEEPPERTILILTAGHTSDLLPTIVSRCQHIRFNPISSQILVEMLVQRQGLPPNEAVILATLSNGSFARAIAMTTAKNQVGLINLRNWLIEEVDALASRPISLLLAFAAKLSKNKAMVPESLEMIKSYLRDLVICKYYPEKIINQDLSQKIQSMSPKITVASLLAKIKEIQTAQQNIQANANLRLTLETLVMRLAKG